MLVTYYELEAAFGSEKTEYFHRLIDKVTGDGLTLDKAMQYIFRQCLSYGFSSSLLEENRERMQELVSENMEW